MTAFSRIQSSFVIARHNVILVCIRTCRIVSGVAPGTCTKPTRASCDLSCVFAIIITPYLFSVCTYARVMMMIIIILCVRPESSKAKFRTLLCNATRRPPATNDFFSPPLLPVPPMTNRHCESYGMQITFARNYVLQYSCYPWTLRK